MLYVAAFMTGFAVACIGQMIQGIMQGNLVSIPVFVGIVILAWLSVRQTIRKPSRALKFVQYIGWFLAFIGICGLFTDFGDLTSIFSGIGVCIMGLMLVLYSRYGSSILFQGRLPEKKTPQSIPESPKPVSEKVKTNSLKMLFDQAIRCPSARENPDFRNLLTRTRDLYFDLKQKEIPISAVLTGQIEKLLTVYLDLDDDPVQTQKTAELKLKIEDGFDTIYEALENLYDKSRTSDQIDLETDLVSLEMLLRQNGLLDSDFKPKQPT